MKTLFGLLLTLAMFTVHGQIKWQSVEKVYANLIKAVGDGTKIAPPIKEAKTESKVAYYSPTRQTIYIEQKFLQVCETFGADSLNALAFVLGHELAHVYRNHGWVTTNAMGYVDTATQNDWKDLKLKSDTVAKDETEADIFSGFYAMIAGYNTLPIAGKTLRKIYQEYGLPESMDKYPTLEKRIEIANNSMAKSRSLFVLFNVGIYCLATEKYDIAAKIYTNIYNQDYAGAEILNNLAIAEILQGNILSAETPQYFYPIFISTETALDPNSRGSEGEDRIRKGIYYLTEAIKKEDANAAYFLNIACAHAMLNEFVDAEYFIAKAESKGGNKASIDCLRGIIAAKKGDNKLAKSIWKKNKSTDALSAKNYSAFFDKPAESNNVLAQKNTDAFNMPMVDDVDLGDPGLQSKFTFEVVKLPGLKISFLELEKSTLIEVYGGSGVDYRFQSFKSNTFETMDYAWKNVLNSTTSTIESSQNYNVLKAVSKNGESQSEYVKYVWY